MLVTERHFKQKTQYIICTMLRCVRSFPLYIWRVERCVCFWPSCHSRPISSSAVALFSSIRACFTLPVSCLWSCFLFSKSLLLAYPVFFAVYLWKFYQCTVLWKLCFLNWYLFLISFVSIVKWHITIPAYRYCIKN